jgi:hypothetical protein
MSHEDELPDFIEVGAACRLLGHHGGTAAVYECSDEAVGCSVEEFYSELEYGYYIVDAEYNEVLDFTPNETVAWAYAAGYDKGDTRSEKVPLFKRSHEPTLADAQRN